MKRSLMIPAVLIALVAMAVMSPSVQAKDGRGTIIQLKPAPAFPTAKGKARYQGSGQRELEIEIEHLRRLAGTRVSFFVNNARVGTSRMNAFGAARLDRRGANFPAIQSGTTIKVKTAGGRLIASGRF
jgi:hypothetical protein